MIDPLETVIVYLRSQYDLQALVDDRIAAKHEYGSKWKVGEAGITVHPDGGVPDLYVPHQVLTVQMRCYAATPVVAMALWRTLVEISRETERELVPTSAGNALLYRLSPAGGPITVYDPDVKMDAVVIVFEADVAESVVM